MSHLLDLVVLGLPVYGLMGLGVLVFSLLYELFIGKLLTNRTHKITIVILLIIWFVIWEYYSIMTIISFYKRFS